MQKEKTNKPVALVLKNGNLDILTKWLAEAKLHGQRARARNRIVKLIGEKAVMIEKERMIILGKYSKKTKDGELETKEVEDVFGKKTRQYVIADQEKFNKQYQSLIDEDAVFDLLPSNREDFKIAKEIVLNLNVEMDFNQTDVYEQVCSAFEKI